MLKLLYGLNGYTEDFAMVRHKPENEAQGELWRKEQKPITVSTKIEVQFEFGKMCADFCTRHNIKPAELFRYIGLPGTPESTLWWPK